MKSHRAAILILAVLLGPVSACDSSTGSTPTPTRPPAVSSAPVHTAADTYDSAQRLVGGLNEAGIACINWERVEEPLNAVELGSCYVGEQQIVAAIHASSADATGQPAYSAALLAGAADVIVVVGGNWTLSCDVRELCARIEKDFGGQWVVIPA